MSCCSFFVCKQKTAYEMRISDWMSDVCSSDLGVLQLLDDVRVDADLGGGFVEAPEGVIEQTVFGHHASFIGHSSSRRASRWRARSRGVPSDRAWAGRSGRQVCASGLGVSPRSTALWPLQASVNAMRLPARSPNPIAQASPKD